MKWLLLISCVWELRKDCLPVSCVLESGKDCPLALCVLEPGKDCRIGGFAWGRFGLRPTAV